MIAIVCHYVHSRLTSKIAIGIKDWLKFINGQSDVSELRNTDETSDKDADYAQTIQVLSEKCSSTPVLLEIVEIKLSLQFYLKSSKLKPAKHWGAAVAQR
jgi:hypothetical protein